MGSLYIVIDGPFGTEVRRSGGGTPQGVSVFYSITEKRTVQPSESMDMEKCGQMTGKATRKLCIAYRVYCRGEVNEAHGPKWGG